MLFAALALKESVFRRLKGCIRPAEPAPTFVLTEFLAFNRALDLILSRLRRLIDRAALCTSVLTNALLPGLLTRGLRDFATRLCTGSTLKNLR